MSAILRAANTPPRFSGSGWTMLTTSCFSRSANCCFDDRLSPVAIGTGLRRATSIIALILVCGTGSSNHAGRNVWMASANSMAVRDVKTAMALDQQVDGRPDRGAHRANDVEAEVEVVASQRAPGRSRTDRTSSPCSLAPRPAWLWPRSSPASAGRDTSRWRRRAVSRGIARPTGCRWVDCRPCR